MARYLLPFFKNTNTPKPVSFIFIGFILLFFILIPLISGLISFIKSKKNKFIATFSSHEILIEKGGIRKKILLQVPVSEIIDIVHNTNDLKNMSHHRNIELYNHPDLSKLTWLKKLTRILGSGGITIKTRTQLFTFGAGLSEEETSYLHYLILDFFKS
ncbi:MAG: hypothetical protein JXQ65_09145 [Candidatus Marinimicrobia bacterium]|nr:hypothetical protein [Candidatus Neomarinimicrobiota bacterium]